MFAPVLLVIPLMATPEAPQLQRLLHEAVERGTRWVAVEISSHALAQKRSFATDFAAVVFTNLTRDHLDYHRDMGAYLDWQWDHAI